jgi:adenylate cyclase
VEVAPLRPSTLGPLTPSLLAQAEAVAQLAAGWVPRRVPGGAWTEAALALLLGALAAAAVARRPGEPGLAVAALLAVLWPAAAAAGLRFGPLLLDPVLPAAAALLGGAGEAAAAARRLARERARLLDRFAHRVPAGILDRLLALPEAERLRPERLRVTVVATDLAGFSPMVRRSDPAAVVAALNAYLAGIEALVTDAGGTLERLIGDGALVVFGAPVPQPDHSSKTSVSLTLAAGPRGAAVQDEVGMAAQHADQQGVHPHQEAGLGPARQPSP